MAKRWIVVAVGKRPGIYNDWIEAQPHVHGVPGALFKGYPTLEEAEQAFEKARGAGTVKSVRMESAEGENEFRRPNPAGDREGCRQPPAPESRPRPQHDAGQTSSARPSAPKSKGKQEPEEKYQPDSRHRTRDDGTSRRPMSSGRPGEPQASSSHVDRRQAAYKEESELEHILKMMKMEDSSSDMSAHRDASQCHSANRSRKSSYLSSSPTGVSQNLPSGRSPMSERGSPVSVFQRSSSSQQSPVEDARNVGGSSNSAIKMPRTPPAWRGQQGVTPKKCSSDIESLYMSNPPSRRPRNAQSTSSLSTGPSGQIGLATSSSSSRKITRTESMSAVTSSSPPTEVTQYGFESLPPSPLRGIRRAATRDANTQTIASPVQRTQSVQAPSIKEESLDDDENAWMAAHGDVGADDPPVFDFAWPSSSASRSPCKCSPGMACPTCGRSREATVPNTPRTRPATPVLSSLSPELSLRAVASCVSPMEEARASVPTTPAASAGTSSRVPLPASPRSPVASPSGRARYPGAPLYPSLSGVSEMLGPTGLSQPMHAANVVHDAVLDPRSPFAGSTRVPMFSGRSHAFGRPTPPIMPGTLSLAGEP